LQENYLQRVFDGLDIPKDMISGMEGVRYSNALAVNDNYYKGHIEPLIVLISDILTYAYLRPMLHKAGVPDEIKDRFVVWYNPAAIVTRPDRSASADAGLANGSISGQDAAGIPSDVAQLLEGGTGVESPTPAAEGAPAAPAAPGAVTEQPTDPSRAEEINRALNAPSDGAGEFLETEGQAESTDGGDLSRGGSMPPRPR
jgi:hypothetical protein